MAASSAAKAEIFPEPSEGDISARFRGMGDAERDAATEAWLTTAVSGDDSGEVNSGGAGAEPRPVEETAAVDATTDTDFSPVEETTPANRGRKQPEPKVITPGEPDLDAAPPSADLVRVYLNEIGKVALLNAADEVELAKRIEAGLYANHLLATPNNYKVPYRRELRAIAIDGERAKDHLLRANLKLVVSLAKRYTGHGMPFLDLIQEGTLGLIRAAEKFDYTKGFKFSTYATWWIRQALSRAMADQSRTIRLPYYLFEQVNKLQRRQREMNQDLGRMPTHAELAVDLDITEDRVQELIDVAREPISLNQTVKGHDNQEDTELEDFITDKSSLAAPEATVESDMMRAKLQMVLDTLDARESTVVRMRYGIDGGQPKTLDEIGRMLKLSSERIRQIERETMAKLRHPSRKEALRDFLDK